MLIVSVVSLYFVGFDLSVLLCYQPVEEASAGDIVMIAGLDMIGIGDTVVDPANPIPMVRSSSSCVAPHVIHSSVIAWA